MNNKLLCCPLCKEEPNLILISEKGFFLNCKKECKEKIKIELSEEKDKTVKIFKQRAIDIWNKRAGELEIGHN